MPLAIGLNSGSSFDGIDATLVEIELGGDGHPTRPRFLAGTTRDWPASVASQVLKAFANELTIFELTRLHYVAGAVYADAAKQLLDQERLTSPEVDVIGVDGQTIYQEPPERERYSEVPDDDIVARWLNGPYPCGLQIGEPAIIAAHCDIPVVWNFRPSDHALGGNAAPLMQYLDFVAFRDLGRTLTLNIGGIANIQLASPDRSEMMAFDTGPGNVMIDHAMGRLYGKPYDPDGKTAAAGAVDGHLLQELQTHPFFDRKPPRSAWRLDFGASYADAVIDQHAHLKAEDIVATFTRFTAWSIALAITRFIPRVEEIEVVIASGGGVRNSTLLAMTQEELPPHMRLASSGEYGIPPQYKEAVKFATLAFAARRLLANNIPAAGGASRFAVLGKTVYPPSCARESGGVAPLSA